MKKCIRIILSLFLLVSFCGCANSTPETSQETPKQDAGEDTTVYPEAESKQLSSFYESVKEEKDWGTLIDFHNNKTAPEAFRRYRDFSNRFLLSAINRGENEFVSPLSFYYAMAMLANGASGDTRAKIENALGMNVDDLNAFLSDLDVSYENDYGVQFLKANALWFNTHHGLSLKQSFKDTITQYYGQCIGEYDFGDGSGLSKTVNAWASEKTKGGINDLVSDSDFDEDTSFLILNALLSGDKWSFPFDAAETKLQEFHTYNGETKMCEMMHQELWGHWSDDLSQGFAKMLDNSIMVSAILPNEGVDVYDYLNQMTPDTLIPYAVMDTGYGNIEEKADYSCIADYHYTDLAFPKFTIEKEYDLSQSLKKLGLSELFSDSTCDLSNMAEGDPATVAMLYVDQVKQKAQLKVDEKEVVASAVTIVMGGLGAAGCDERQTYHHEVIFDRPFIIALTARSGDTLLPLFIGVVADLGEDASGAIRIENITGKINIRKEPSASAERVGTYQKGEVVYAYETKEAEGYTWYRIGEGKWVADKGGEWIKVLD